MTKQPEFKELREAMDAAARFAQAWAAAITEKFKPLNEAVAKMQRGSGEPQ